MKLIRRCLESALLVLALTASALAADITVTVNATGKTITITNQLPRDIDLLYLKGGDGTYHVSAQIATQQSVTVPYTRDVPAGLTSAALRTMSEDGIPGYTSDDSGLYVIEADVIL